MPATTAVARRERRLALDFEILYVAFSRHHPKIDTIHADLDDTLRKSARISGAQGLGAACLSPGGPGVVVAGVAPARLGALPGLAGPGLRCLQDQDPLGPVARQVEGDSSKLLLQLHCGFLVSSVEPSGPGGWSTSAISCRRLLVRCFPDPNSRHYQ